MSSIYPVVSSLILLESHLAEVCEQSEETIEVAIEIIRSLANEEVTAESLFSGLSFDASEMKAAYAGAGTIAATSELDATGSGSKEVEGKPANKAAGTSFTKGSSRAGLLFGVDSRIKALVLDLLIEEKLPQKIADAGYNSRADYVLAMLEETLDERAHAQLTHQHEGLVALLIPKPLPNPLPDLIGTNDAPGLFCVEIDARLAAIEALPPEEWLSGEYERLNWSIRLAKWKETWCDFKTILIAHSKLPLFSFEPAERKKQHQGFAYQLHLIYQALSEKNEDSLLFDQLGELLGVCRTGWQETIDQLNGYAGLGSPCDFQLDAQRIARDLRRDSLLLKGLKLALERSAWPAAKLIDPHFQLAGKQAFNKLFNLGYSHEELGRREMLCDLLESEPSRSVIGSSLETNYTKRALIERLEMRYRELEGYGSTLFNPLLDAYQDSFLKGQAPVLDEMTHWPALYEKLAESVKESDPIEKMKQLRRLHGEFCRANIQPSYSLSTLREALGRELLMNRQLSFWVPARLKLELQKPTLSLAELLDALKSALLSYQKIEAERSVDELAKPLPLATLEKIEAWLERYTLCETHESIAAFAEEQFTLASKMLSKASLTLAIANRQLFEHKLTDHQQLSPFGLEIWLASAKLTKPVIAAGDNATKSQALLLWAYQLALPMATCENLLSALDSHPELYALLSVETRESPAVQEKVKINPGLVYGLSHLEYQWAIKNPVLALSDERYAWVREIRALVLESVSQEGTLLRYASSQLRKDREIVLKALCQDGNALKYASVELRADEKIVLAAAGQNARSLLDADAKLRNDPTFMLKAIRANPKSMNYLSPSLKEDKAFLFEALSLNGLSFPYILNQFKTDRALLKVALTQNGMVLESAGIAFKIDREMVLTALNQNGLAIKHADKLFRADKAAALIAVRNNGLVLEYFVPLLKEDPEIVLAAMAESIAAFKYAGREFRNIEERVLAVVEQDGLLLEYANERLKKESKVVEAAIRQNGRALEFASETLRAKKDLVEIALRQCGLALEFASNPLKADPTLVEIALRQCGLALKYADPAFKESREHVLIAITQNGMALQFANEDFLTDRALRTIAVSSNGEAISLAPLTFRDDRELALIAVRQSGLAYCSLSSRLKADKAIALLAVAQDALAMLGLPQELREDQEVILAAIKQNSWVLNQCDAAHQDDEILVLAAVERQGLSLQYASERLRGVKKIVLAAIAQDRRAICYATSAMQLETEIQAAAAS